MSIVLTVVPLARKHFLARAVVLGAALGAFGCFTTPNINVKTISCELPEDCPAGYVCKNPGVTGGHVDAFAVDAIVATGLDGASSLPDTPLSDVSAAEAGTPDQGSLSVQDVASGLDVPIGS
jgi:hypothetical protein